MVLNNPVLMLNASWMPIDVITVAQAIEKICNYRAKFVDQDYSVHDFDSWTQLAAIKNEPALHTATLSLRVPEVIVLTNYDKTPANRFVFSRRNVYRRDKYTCQYCGSRTKSEELTIDHVLPRSRGGKSTWTNCVLACFPCNSKKGDKTPLEAGMRLRRNPKKPKWSPQLVVMKVRNVPVSWEHFVSDAYWNTELK